MNTRKKRELFGFILFVLPAFILIFITQIWPFFGNLYYSLMKWDGIKEPVFLGLENFVELFTDDRRMKESFLFTFKYMIVTVIAINVLALLTALLLDLKIRSRNVLRTIFFLPNALSSLIAGLMFSFIFVVGFERLFEVTGWGFFNYSWLGDRKLAWISVAVVDVWKQMGYFMVIYIAGLQAVPTDIIESARVDGASGVQTFFKITLPMLMPSITICLLLSMSNALNGFDIPYALTGGGPGYSTTGMPLNIYKEAFSNTRFGYASAKSLVYFVVVMLVSVFQLRATQNKEVEV